MSAKTSCEIGMVSEECAMTKGVFGLMATTARLAVVVGTMLVAVMTTPLIGAGQAAADVAGDWALTVETDQGTTAPSVTLEQNGAELTGHYSSETLGEATVTGSVNGNEVRFSLEAEVQGFGLEVVYTGTVQSDGTLTGQIALGDLGGGTFTGKRR